LKKAAAAAAAAHLQLPRRDKTPRRRTLKREPRTLRRPRTIYLCSLPQILSIRGAFT
jgi:hypothetical protein